MALVMSYNLVLLSQHLVKAAENSPSTCTSVSCLRLKNEGTLITCFEGGGRDLAGTCSQ